MQSATLSIKPGNTTTLPITGSGFFYESGSSSTADPYILVKGTTGGAEVRVKPGQSFRGSDVQSYWTITAEDATATISGNVIIGNGDFNDNNTANTVTIAATGVPNANAMPMQLQALSTITDENAVTIAAANTIQPLIADPTQRILRIRNGHATAKLYLGSASLTIGNAAIVLNPGDLWIEEEAAGASWFAISDTTGCIVQIQGVKL